MKNMQQAYPILNALLEKMGCHSLTAQAVNDGLTIQCGEVTHFMRFDELEVLGVELQRLATEKQSGYRQFSSADGQPRGDNVEAQRSQEGRRSREGNNISG